MTANERWQAARLAADEGRHEEALREFIWFHHHALETEPSLRGVRLSYALRDWVALASRYPPALVALEQIRDAKSNALLNGDGDLDTFRDVEAINRDLDSVPRTYALFAQIAAANPALAQQCARKAFPALVAAGDFALAARFLPEPENYVRSLAETFNEAILSLESTPESNAPALQAFAYNYVCDVRLVLAVLTGVGRVEDGSRASGLALALVQDNNVREMVEDGLAAADSALLNGSWFVALLNKTGFPE